MVGEPGGEQPEHAHPENEQAYVIVAGQGVMFVGEERQEVGPGTLVLVPPPNLALDSEHRPGEETYVSATSPPFELPSADSEFAYH